MLVETAFADDGPVGQTPWKGIPAQEVARAASPTRHGTDGFQEGEDEVRAVGRGHAREEFKFILSVVVSHRGLALLCALRRWLYEE